MLSLPRLYAFLGIGLIAVAVAFLAPSMTPGGGLPTAHAGVVMADCVDLGELLCISLDPEADTNPTGDDHTVTATLSLTVKGQPIKVNLSGLPIAILVYDGPNAGTSVTGVSDANGQLSLTYMGGGGAGTDSIGAVACMPKATCDLSGLITTCLADPAACQAALTPLQGPCFEDQVLFCDVAEKEWVEPTPTSEPPTPTSTPEVMADVALPETGAGPADGGPASAAWLAWLATVGGAVVAMSAGAAWIAYKRRRVR